jgi:formylglycine-generating enzyme required for sulfatase activity
MDAIAWTGKNAGGTTHPVGQKQPNAWGLYDMIGNVCQWTMDWWGAYSGGGQIDPEGPGASGGRTVRGGSWLHGEPVWFRASSRYGQGTNNFRWNNLGLRCVAN